MIASRKEICFMEKKGQTKKILIIIACILGLVFIGGIFVVGVFLGRYMVMHGAEDVRTVVVDEETADGQNAGNEDETQTSEKTGTEQEKIPAAQTGQEGEPETVSEEAFQEIEADIHDNTEDDPTEFIEEEDVLQVVILGDSIYDMVRDGTGLAYLVAEGLNANVYNLSVGGLSATVDEGDSTVNEEWNSTCGVGIAKILSGKVSVDTMRDCTAKKLITENYDRFKDTDLFIVEYGINDYLAEHPLGYGNFGSDYFYFCNALEQIVDELRDTAPGAEILLCEPHFCEFYGKDGTFLGSSNMVSNKYGTLLNYKENVDYVANTRGTYLWEAYLNSGINSYNTADYLLDGIHMTESGRQKYADEMCSFIRRNILKIEDTENSGDPENVVDSQNTESFSDSDDASGEEGTENAEEDVDPQKER